MAQMPGRMLLDASIDDVKLNQLVTANKVAATAVEDKFVRNDGADSSSGKISAHGFDAGSQKITSVANGVNPNDAVNLQQLESLASGLFWKDPAKSYILNNTQAPPTEILGDRYVLSTGGGTPHPNWDGALPSDIVQFNGTVWVAEHPSSHAAILMMDTDAAYTFDTTSSSWIQFSGAGQINAGDGLAKDGNTLDVVVSDFAGYGLENDGFNNLRIASSGIGDGLDGGSGTAIKFSASEAAGVGLEDDLSNNLRISVQGNGLDGGGGALLSVKQDLVGGTNVAAVIHVSTNGVGLAVDNSTVGNNGSGQLCVKSNGITGLQINTSAIGNGLQGGGGSAISVKTDSTGGSNLAKVVNAISNGLSIKIDNTSIGENLSNQLEVKASGIGLTHLMLSANSGLYSPSGNLVAVQLKVGGGLIYDSGLAVDLGQLSTLDPVVDEFTLTGTDISNGYITLSQTPVAAAEVLLFIVGGFMQRYSVEYTVNTVLKRLTFIGNLAIDLIAGDQLVVTYHRAT